ncbi:YncE family protein [Bacteroidales bacterium OttesenSCG-928-J19]|nr:YncE family protein [Bacteroidales bacterium OttesenSCG-928-J19]
MLVLLLLLISCREEYEIVHSEEIQVTLPSYGSIEGFYLLNEGSMGMNKATLDYFNDSTGVYTRNIFGMANPTVIKEMGDVGNDLQIYGEKMYAVINCSNKIDVLDAYTAVKLGQIDLQNPRYIRFHEGYAYVSAYDCPVQINPDKEIPGCVVKIDTASLEIVDRCTVGPQPEEMVIVNGHIYVANSGGYMPPYYANTLSVIDLSSFREVKRIEVAPNLHRLRVDRFAQLWTSSRGDYYGQSSKLYCIDLYSETVVDSLDMAVSNMHLAGDSLYVIGTEWSYITEKEGISYGIVHVTPRTVVTRQFITDGTEKKIRKPYGLSVHPISGDILVTDARNMVSPGKLYCFDREGKLRWEVSTGDSPAHIAFLGEQVTSYKLRVTRARRVP